MHSGHLQYVLSTATVCQAQQPTDGAVQRDFSEASSTEASVNMHGACHESAPFQVLLSADSACVALIMHELGVHGVPEHLRPLVLGAPRCGLTSDDVIEAMPTLLDNVEALEMCAPFRIHGAVLPEGGVFALIRTTLDPTIPISWVNFLDGKG